jgi:type II secretory pathway pseudopilin PulG
MGPRRFSKPPALLSSFFALRSSLFAINNQPSPINNLFPFRASPPLQHSKMPVRLGPPPLHRSRSPVVSSEWSRRPASAFTLVEMVVVILIIATLAALLMGAATSVFDRARRTQAKNDVIQIVTAVNAFYTEYGKYPVPSGTTTDAFFGSGAAPAGCTPIGNNDLLFNALRGLDNTTNPRAIVFLSPGGAKNSIPPKGGIATDNRYYDPWGSQYAVAMDSDYNNQIGTANPYSDADAGTSPLRFGVIAYSFGKNGALGGGAAVNSSFSPESGVAGQFKGSSDILSWQ